MISFINPKRGLPHLAAAMTPLLVLAACATAQVSEKYVSPEKLFSVAVNENVLTYRGLLTKDGVDRAEKYLSDYPAISVIAIESQGGEVADGMRLGDAVLKRSMDVKVIGSICASSCANYVFLSGNRKFIEAGALVFWHGSDLRPQSIPVTVTNVDDAGRSVSKSHAGAELLEYLKRPDIAAAAERDRMKQNDFFRARGIDGRVTVFGQEVGCDCEWTFTVDDMKRFGIDRVHTDSSYPDTSPLLESLSVATLRLADYPGHVSGSKD